MSKADHELEIPDQGGLNRMVKDLFAGAVGGVAQVLIGQPFDIVKVRLQTTQQYTGALDAATQIYKNEGALAFYKGTLTPLIVLGPVFRSNLVASIMRAVPLRHKTPANMAHHNSPTLNTTPQVHSPESLILSSPAL
jgi:hypothetical protein